MAQLNPRIILSGAQPDIPGAFQRGLEFKQQRKSAAQEQQAGAQKNQNSITAETRQRDLFEARRALALIQRADTPEKWDYIAAKAAPDLVGQFERREEITDIYQTIVEALDPRTPDKIKVMNVGGALIQLTPRSGGYDIKTLRKAAPKAAGKSSALHQRAVEGGLTPGTEEFQQFMRSGGRSQFRVINDPVTKRLVVFDMNKMEIVGEAPPEAVEGAEIDPEDTLFAQAKVSTGLWSALLAFAADVPGQIPGAVGEFFVNEEVVKGRQDFATSTQAMLQAFVINPKFPVAEVNRIKDEIGAVVGAFTSPNAMEIRLRSLDRSLDRSATFQEQTASDPRISSAEAAAAAANARSMRQFIKIMGVPPEGEIKPEPEEVFDLQNEVPWGDDIEQRLRAYD